MVSWATPLEAAGGASVEGIPSCSGPAVTGKLPLRVDSIGADYERHAELTEAFAVKTTQARWLLRWCLALCCWLLAAQSFALPVRSILVIYANNRLTPGAVAFDRGLRDAMARSAHGPVQVFSEFLDIPYFTGPALESNVASYIHTKYAARPPLAIVAVADGAVDFIVRNHLRLFPGVPIVHAVTSQSYLLSLTSVPADMVGVPMEYDFAGTIETALRLHPRAQRLLVVTGASKRDRGWESRLRREAPPAASGVEIEFLAGLTTPALLQRLRALDARTVVFTPGYYEDGEGHVFNPGEAVALLAPAAGAPIYGRWKPSSAAASSVGDRPASKAWGGRRRPA